MAFSDCSFWKKVFEIICDNVYVMLYDAKMSNETVIMLLKI